MIQQGNSADAVRQIEYWYKHYVDSFVQDARASGRPAMASAAGRSEIPAAATSFPVGHMRPVNDELLAEVHETVWRHAVVKAQSRANKADWAAITVKVEGKAYLDLLDWSAAKYRVSTEATLARLAERGHRQHPR